MTEDKTQRKIAAQSEYSDAQLAEQEAREANDFAGIDEAKAEQVEALDEIHEIEESIRTFADEGRVTLVSPNPRANITDSNGLEFVDGKAQGVRRSVAEKYVFDLGSGYKIEEE